MWKGLIMPNRQHQTIIKNLRRAIADAIRQAARQIDEADSAPPVKAKERHKRSGLKAGVTLDKRTGKYGAKINCDGRYVWLGTYETEAEAANAFDAASLMRAARKSRAEIEATINPERQKRPKQHPQSNDLSVD